ncbi:putative calcium-transporting ATPase 13, plasma membrane-type isoform X5 [Quercus robur]|uniref:putative calcium-transporting ATPase 13, plasma membrane-type isoform X5 n=1 Tax=Quercus robur TaxID=38942 RepID=UPI002163C494|nr:putative calcium-transporting ATPase 13, plasma membrane-type isoform X5 [Quercus robur]
MSTMRFRKPSEIAICDEGQEDWWSVSKTHKRRWRTAFTAISFTRLLFSLSKKVLDKDGSLLRTLSYVAIDVQRINEDSPLDSKAITLLTVDPTKLRDTVRDKNFESLSEFGGVKELALILETDVKNGINGSEADLIHRQNVFGANKYHKPPPKRFIRFVLDALKDTTIIILLACAVLSLGFGIKQHGWKDGWYDGGSIILAVFLVVAVSAVSDFKQSKQFQKLSTKSSDITVEVVRDGRRQPISIFDVVVGDIVCLKIGDQVPSDGLFLEGHSLKVDESSMTGESDHIEINQGNPFMLSGTKVTDGYGFMLVTSVGMNTAWGEMMSSINRDLNEETPLQARLNKLTSYIGKIGLLVAALVLVVMLIRYFTGNTRDDKGNKEFIGSKTKFNNVMNVVVSIVSAAVTIIVVAIPEGLPLAVTLTLAYSMKCMMADNAMVRKLSSCETMGSATIICTDKTGTLTLNEMKVTEFWLGKEAVKDDTFAGLAGNILKLLHQAVSLNTTATVYKPHSTSVPEISGSPTEKAILSWAVLNLDMSIDEVKQNYHTIHVEAFNSEKKRSGVLVKRNNEKIIHTHWKGAAEMILAMCSSYYDREGVLKVMDEEERLQLETTIKNMAQKSLRCIAFAYIEVEEESGQAPEKLEENGLTLLGFVGLKDPCRPGVSAAVESCKAAGVNIKMITGDNVHTARAIALECKILNPDEDLDNEAVVEGVQFRNYSPEERMEKIDKILVMARSSPFDKLLMVQCLKKKGHVVAVTGDGTNDAPALKEADIGLSMGIQGTEVAKESSDIVILDDNFTSVVTVLKWGRCVYTNIQKFIQFQLTVNVAALVINFVAAVSSGKVPLTAVQLLWVNLIMDTLGALALATEKPTNDLMANPPIGRSKPLITKIMWRNLMAQAVYQVTILLVLQFKGNSIFSVKESIKRTLIFNTFVLCQVFNEFNARKLEKKNIFKGILKNKLFIAIVGITIVLQLVMVEFLKRFANTERLDWGQWGVCIGLAALSWPIGWLVKCIPVSEDQIATMWSFKREVE